MRKWYSCYFVPISHSPWLPILSLALHSQPNPQPTPPSLLKTIIPACPKSQKHPPNIHPLKRRNKLLKPRRKKLRIHPIISKPQCIIISYSICSHIHCCDSFGDHCWCCACCVEKLEKCQQGWGWEG